MKIIVYILCIVSFSSLYTINFGGENYRFFLGDLFLLLSVPSLLLIRMEKTDRSFLFIAIAIFIQSVLSIMFNFAVRENRDIVYQTLSFLSTFRYFLFFFIGYNLAKKVNFFSMMRVIYYAFSLLVLYITYDISHFNFFTLLNASWMWHFFLYNGDLVYGYPNAISVIYVIYFWLGVLLYRSKMIPMWIFFGINGMTVLHLACIGSRSGLLAFVVSLCVSIILGIKFLPIKGNKLHSWVKWQLEDRRRRRIIWGAVFILIILLFTVTPDYLVYKITKTIQDGGDLDESSLTRIELWSIAFKAAFLNPVFGSGYIPFRLITENIYDVSLSTPHQDYATFAYKSGFLGLGLWLGLIWMIAKRFIAQLKEGNLENKIIFHCLLSLLIGILFSSITQENFNYILGTPLIYFIFGYAIAFSRIEKKMNVTFPN